MKTIQRIFWAHLLTAVAVLAIGYAWSGVILAALVIVLFGALWYASQQHGGPGIEGIVFTLFVLASAGGFYLGIAGWLLLLVVVASLGAWDLDHFLQRLSAVDRVAFETGLGRQHIRRLLIVEGIGYLAGLTAITIRLQISFGWVALLIFMAVVGISQVVQFVKKQSEK